MPSLFHFVPNQMIGSMLYPLNELERVDPGAWRREREKYRGREDVLELPIPPLGCLWNDVLHLSTVHPSKIVSELEAVGLESLRKKAFEINPFALDQERTVVFVNRRGSIDDPLDASQWEPFNPRAIARLSEFNEASRRYYRECALRGSRPLLYGYLPHVLHRGPLDTRTLRVIEV